MSIWLALAPATDQIWFTSTPSTHGPGMASTTADGPSPHVDCEPVNGDVAVGNDATGPTPQVRRPGSLGERNAVTVRLPSPVVPAPPVKLGWLTMGRMVRVMTFQSSVTCSGMTGWKLRTFWTSLFPGP